MTQFNLTENQFIEYCQNEDNSNIIYMSENNELFLGHHKYFGYNSFNYSFNGQTYSFKTFNIFRSKINQLIEKYSLTRDTE